MVCLLACVRGVVARALSSFIRGARRRQVSSWSARSAATVTTGPDALMIVGRARRVRIVDCRRSSRAQDRTRSTPETFLPYWRR